MKKKSTYNSEYWHDWYWNRGGRDKVQVSRKLNEYKRYKRQQENGTA